MSDQPMPSSAKGPPYYVLLEGDVTPILLHEPPMLHKRYRGDNLEATYLSCSTPGPAREYLDRREAEVAAELLGGRVVSGPEWERLFTDWAGCSDG